eukprot:345962_1
MSPKQILDSISKELLNDDIRDSREESVSLSLESISNSLQNTSPPPPPVIVNRNVNNNHYYLSSKKRKNSIPLQQQQVTSEEDSNDNISSSDDDDDDNLDVTVTIDDINEDIYTASML